jgi:hypothetical protein
MRIAGVLAVALSFVSLHAHADNKAWSAAKVGLSANTKVVVGIDVAALRKTQLFATALPKLLEKAGATELFDTVKTVCKLDPVAITQSIVFAASDDDEGAAYIALGGIDKARLSTCLQLTSQKLAETDKVTVKHDGNVTQVSDGKESFFVGWVGKDILVVALRPEDKAVLARWMGGKGALAKSSVGKRIAKVNTAAAVWGAGEVTQEVQPGVTAKAGYGAIALAKGTLDADLHAVLENAAQAATLASASKQQLDEAKQAIFMPPAVSAVLKTIAITTVNDEVVVKAIVAESDLVSALNLAITMGL